MSSFDLEGAGADIEGGRARVRNTLSRLYGRSRSSCVDAQVPLAPGTWQQEAGVYRAIAP